MTELRLLTIPPSHFSEKARWALDRSGLRYREERHPPLLHRFALWRAGGGRSCPALVTPRGTLRDSADILAYVDESLEPERRLYPEDFELRRQIQDYEQQLGKELGLSIARWAYFYLLAQKEDCRRLLTEGVAGWEKGFYRWFYPLVALLMRKGLHLEASSIERARQRIDKQLDLAGDRLSDGRPYLLGDRFSAADLTLAALTAPIFSVAAYGGSSLPMSELPSPMREQGERWQSHPVAGFVRRIYAEHRPA